MCSKSNPEFNWHFVSKAIKEIQTIKAINKSISVYFAKPVIIVRMLANVSSTVDSIIIDISLDYAINDGSTGCSSGRSN